MSGLHKRWLTEREIITTQGFPIDVSSTFGKPCSSYALRYEKIRQSVPASAGPSRNQLCAQIGNSMHTSCSGVMLLYSLTQVMMNPGMMYAQYNALRQSERMSVVRFDSCKKLPASSPHKRVHERSDPLDGSKKVKES